MSRYGFVGKQLPDDAGNPLIDGKLSFFESGTTTPKDTFADINESIPNSNPVILSGAGRPPNIFFTGSARVVLTDKNDVQIEVHDPEGTGIGVGAFSNWDVETAYPADTLVTGPDGLYYRAISALGQGQAPPNVTFWEQVDFTFYYNANVTYPQDAIVITADGRRYVSRIAANLGNTPSTSAVEWKPDQTTGIAKVVRTSDTTLLAVNNNNLIDATGTFTQTLDPALDLSEDWFCYYRNSGAGSITLDPAGAETINGAATLLVIANSAVLLQCDGTSFTAIVVEAPPAETGAMILLSTVSASAASTVDIDAGFSTTFDDYMILASGMTGSAQSFVQAVMKIGGTFLVAGYDGHTSQLSTPSAAYGAITASNAADVSISRIFGGAGDAANFILNLFDVNDILTANGCTFAGGSYPISIPTFEYYAGAFNNRTVGVLTGIRLTPVTGTITGEFRLYGIKKA